MEKFDYFREKTGKNLNYNHYSGKLTPGCERSVIKIPPQNVYRSKRLSSLFYLQNSDCFAFQQFVKREFTICCDWLSECCYVDVCFKHHCDKENCLYYEAREMGFDFGIPNILFNSFR